MTMSKHAIFDGCGYLEYMLSFPQKNKHIAEAKMSTNEQTADTKSKIDWPVIAFFVIAYGIAWGLILVFNAVARASGIEDGSTLMAMTEALELVFPGLAETDWQIPAYLGMLLISIILGAIMWRRSLGVFAYPPTGFNPAFRGREWAGLETLPVLEPSPRRQPVLGSS